MESHDACKDSQRFLCPARRSRARTHGTLLGALPAGCPQLRWQYHRLVRGVLHGRAAAFTPRFGKLLTAGLALAVVELFEISNGFGVMTNVYDPVDFAANAVGIALALAVDIVTEGIGRRPLARGEQTGSGMEGRPVAWRASATDEQHKGQALIQTIPSAACG